MCLYVYVSVCVWNEEQCSACLLFLSVLSNVVSGRDPLWMLKGAPGTLLSLLTDSTKVGCYSR